jgi:hypothetical protein
MDFVRTQGSIPALVLAALVAALPLPSRAQAWPCVGVNVAVPPPPLPAYSQPPPPAPNYIWNPGYWAWGAYGYYWVPGVWVAPPAVGLYWTPGYWAFSGGGYVWNAGYWGASVGFYGGLNYGFGYFGIGFVGGTWAGGTFNYNTAVTNVNTTIIHDTYFDKTVINRSLFTHRRVSFNGGHGGLSARPTAAQRAIARRPHVDPTAEQLRHAQMAGLNRNNLAAFNHGRPRRSYRPLSNADRVVAQRQALSRLHVAGAPSSPQRSRASARSSSERTPARSTSGHAGAGATPNRHAAPAYHAPQAQGAPKPMQAPRPAAGHQSSRSTSSGQRPPRI